MPISASPAYLGQDFAAASPGLRFGLLLPVWTSRGTWAKDKNKDKDSARQTWKGICALGDADRERMRALAARQAACAAPLLEAGCLLALEAIATAPFTTGLGNEHPLENGFAFLNPHGLPYLPGSGVKGVLRRAARELASGDWGDAQGWTQDAITHLFGLDTDKGDQSHQRGALSFWDVLPQIDKDCSLQVEVMTSHQSHYHHVKPQDKADDCSGGSTSPHDSGKPNPILFLTVPPRSRFLFHVQCDLPLLQRLAPPLAEAGRWQVLLQAAFAHAFAWLGFGAKTAVGYGAMAEDPAAAQRRAEAQAERERQAAAAAEAERKARLSPEDRAWEEAEPVIAAFRAAFERARQAPFNPGGPFNQARLSFMATALGWTEPRSRAAAAQVLEASATKAWGRPSKKERWEELQRAIAELKGQA